MKKRLKGGLLHVNMAATDGTDTLVNIEACTSISVIF